VRGRWNGGRRRREGEGRREEERRGGEMTGGKARGWPAPPESGEPWSCLCPTPEGPKLM